MLKPYYQESEIEAGCDEAGRGCLVGPVFAAAVILPQNFSHLLLNDSKKLTEKARYQLRAEIEEHAIAFAVASVSHEEIDKINILNASFLAMHRAIAQLKILPGFLIIDGNRFNKYKEIPHQCIVKGDAKYYAIAAASVLAKTYRDDYMKLLSGQHPQYNWHINKGYPTLQHRSVTAALGFTPYHRKTFKITNPQLSIFC